MTHTPLDKNYNSQLVEDRWGTFWIDQKLFQPVQSAAASFSMVIPPPNVTGSLHIGHALNNTLQDILTRWKRMQGGPTLWLPGTDHAGIATQNVVERQLAEEGLAREQMARETFIQKVWQWREQSGDTIIGQLKQLGASCDWTRLRFTLDDGLSEAVREVFVRLYEEGLIYRGERLINWCPRCLTALSDIEVEHEPLQSKMYHIRYPLADNPDHELIVATTRPETLFGDQAVAIHPEDSRYQEFIGKHIQLPLTTRLIPIVPDSILVDREFGTGAVKITPAHDFNDFEAGQRHKLSTLSILDYRAHLDSLALEEAGVHPELIGKLDGKSVTEARPLVVDALTESHFLLKEEDHTMALGKCYRCKTVVEPYLSPQWFVKIQPLADPAIQAVEQGDIRIIPEEWQNNYLGWMRQIKDWCISRQIWWGHQIPAWYCESCNTNHLSPTSQPAGIPAPQGTSPAAPEMSCMISHEAEPIVSRTEPEKCPQCGGTSLVRDPDVLDTWFSSALWPFSTLGWPQKTDDLNRFYPTSTLITGLDILFFWVARMIMMGLKFTGEVPFRDVYIHALVRDAEGKKMSKSKGNVIDPLTKMRQYGTDALRFTLTSMASPGRDIKLTEERIEGYRNFVTKIWNAARFIQLHANGQTTNDPIRSRPFPDRWIFSRLNQTIADVQTALTNYRFDQAASALYQFIWHEYCDWYIELSKPCLQREEHPESPATRQTLLESFEIIQRLLHPVMPFITEELWQTFPHSGQSIVTQPYPTENSDWHDSDAEHAFSLINQVITTARTARALLNVSSSHPPQIWVTSGESSDAKTLENLTPYMEAILRGPLNILSPDLWPAGHILRLVTGNITVGTAIQGGVDLQQIISKVQKQIKDKQKEIKRLEGRLSSPQFREKAEPSVIQESESRVTNLHLELNLLTSSEQQLTTMLSP